MADYAKTHGAVGRADLPMFDPDTLLIIGLDTNDGPEHPLFDPSVRLPLDESFVKSIKESGVLEPVLVWKDGEENGKPRVFILAGRDRTRAAREVKKQGIPIKIAGIVRRGTQAEVFREFIEENTQRRARDNPLVLARKIERARHLGYDDASISHLFRLSLPSINTYADLLNAHEKVRTAIEEKTISIGAATEILRLPYKEQTKALTTLLETTAPGKKPKVHAAKKAVAKTNGSEEPVAKWQSKRAVERLIAELEKHRRDIDGDANYASVSGALVALKWVLGDEDAFATYPTLRQAKLDAEKAAKQQKIERGKAMAASKKEAAP